MRAFSVTGDAETGFKPLTKTAPNLNLIFAYLVSEMPIRENGIVQVRKVGLIKPVERTASPQTAIQPKMLTGSRD